MIEYILLGAIIYGISTGQLKNGKQVAQVLGNKLGYAIATFKRIRSEASELAMTVGSNNPDAKAKVSELKSSFDQLRALRYDAASTMNLRPSNLYDTLLHPTSSSPSSVMPGKGSNASVSTPMPPTLKPDSPVSTTTPPTTDKSTSSLMLEMLTLEKKLSQKQLR